MAFGPAAGLELVDALADEPALRAYHLLPSVRGDLLAKLGRTDEARAEFERAARDDAERPRAGAAAGAGEGLRDGSTVVRFQRIQYLHASDGVRLAWADASAGPLVIKAATWLTHLEYEWQSPLWRHWIGFFCNHFRLVRSDERGCGMSDWNVGDLSFERWLSDLESVVAAAAPREPFTLLGISQGGAPCLAFAARHPERVSRLVLFGAHARGYWRRGDSDRSRAYQAIIDLARSGWGKDDTAFRQVFTSRFVPGATAEQMDWFNELCRKTTSPENAAKLMEARARVDVVDVLKDVRAPTLVVHARDDEVVPIEEARLVASGIAGAELVALDSKNHILLEDEPAWKRFCAAVLDFTGFAV